jgi:hypothetical protein
VSKEYTKSVLAGIQRELEREQLRNVIAYREMWTRADEVGTNLFKVYLGDLFGRAEDYEKFSMAVDEASQAFEQGDRSRAIGQTYSALAQLRMLARKAGGILNPADDVERLTDVPDILKQLRKTRDEMASLITDLAGTGNWMEVLEDSNNRIAELKRQQLAWQRALQYQPAARETPKSITAGKSFEETLREMCANATAWGRFALGCGR